MSEAIYPKVRKSAKMPKAQAQAQPVDEYDEYEEDDGYEYEYEEGVPEDDGDGEWEYGDESEDRIVAAPGRAIALGVAGVALLVVFSAVIWLISTRTPQPPTVVDGPNGGVPVMALLQSAEAQAPTRGAFAPDFQWSESNNQAVQLSSFRGTKPVFVNFWGTWCPPCRAEMPAMESFYQKHKDEIQMIGVSMYPRDDPGTVLSFVKDAKYSWKFIHDSDYKVAEKYQVASVPSSYFIDKNGVIKAVQVGAMTEQMMENYLLQVR